MNVMNIHFNLYKLLYFQQIQLAGIYSYFGQILIENVNINRRNPVLINNFLICS